MKRIEKFERNVANKIVADADCAWFTSLEDSEQDQLRNLRGSLAMALNRKNEDKIAVATNNLMHFYSHTFLGSKNGITITPEGATESDIRAIKEVLKKPVSATPITR